MANDSCHEPGEKDHLSAAPLHNDHPKIAAEDDTCPRAGTHDHAINSYSHFSAQHKLSDSSSDSIVTSESTMAFEITTPIPRELFRHDSPLEEYESPLAEHDSPLEEHESPLAELTEFLESQHKLDHDQTKKTDSLSINDLHPKTDNSLPSAHNSQADPATSVAISIKNVSKTYPGQSSPALDDISLDIITGEIFGIIGYSGAGKSTLVRTINGLAEPDSGTVTINNHLFTGTPEKLKRQYRRDIGMIFQQFHLFSSRTVYGNIAFPLKIAKWPKAQRHNRIMELLEYVGLSDYADKHVEQLSGGQKQRVGIARALAANPKILLADEATSALDPQTTREVLALLKKINNELGITIVVITHHMSIIKEICDRVAIISDGKISEITDTYSFLSAPASPTAQKFLNKLVPTSSREVVVNIDKHPEWIHTLYHLKLQGIHFDVKQATIDEITNWQYGQLLLYIYGGGDAVSQVEEAFGIYRTPASQLIPPTISMTLPIFTEKD